MNLICWLVGHRPFLPDAYHFPRCCRHCHYLLADGKWHEEAQ